MSSSLRSRRMKRNHKRMAQQPKLNLVALMDIFTILVLFLIVNNGDVEVLQSDKNVTLPDSLSEQRPELALTVKVSADSIVVDGHTIQYKDPEQVPTDAYLQGLTAALQNYTSHQAKLSQQELDKGRAVIIMGDRDTPYKLLKQIMATCAASGYRNISLAVNSIAAPDEQPVQTAQGG